jgi:hypothetical protein
MSEKEAVSRRIEDSLWELADLREHNQELGGCAGAMTKIASVVLTFRLQTLTMSRGRSRNLSLTALSQQLAQSAEAGKEFSAGINQLLHSCHVHVITL